jgi:acyl-CoA thioester hydrolase
MAAASPSQPFEISVRVEEADIDEQHHVNNIVYLRWAQEAAIAHWRAIAPGEAQSEIGWVVLRHEIDYKAPAFMADELLVKTWVGTAAGLAFERFTEIAHAGKGQILARARTLWCPVNSTTGRPRRVSADVRARFSSGAANPSP